MRKITILIVFIACFFILPPSDVKAQIICYEGQYACNDCFWGYIWPDTTTMVWQCCQNCVCCDTGEGGGGNECTSCTSSVDCKRIDNCTAGGQGSHCGWTKTRPVVEKKWCRSVVCVNTCTCTATAPDTPILSSPANGTQIRKNVISTFAWNAVANWGANCTDPNNSYNLCISSGLASCDLVNESLLSTETQGNWSPAVGNPNVTWSVTANNGALSSTSALGNVCVEGFNIGDPSYLSNWSICSPSNERTRTCREDCGTDDCAGQILTESCNLGSWWQVKDSDVQSAGDLTSEVPSIAGTFFGTIGPGGFPGVSSYGGTTNLTGANVSTTGWIANSAVTNSRVYNYAYFTNQIPTDILSIINDVDIVDVSGSLSSGGSPDTNNYYWYKYDGIINAGQPLTIPATNIGTRKVILLVDNADLNITGNINLTDGQGFFMAIVRGSINVDPAVGGGVNPNLEGLYFADNTFTDGVGSTQLTTRGSIVANGGISMRRDLGADNTPPSEIFEYAPDQIMLFPKIIGTRKIDWKEVAP